MKRVLVIGGGMAGSEAAWQLLRAGFHVTLIESRPTIKSPAHHSLLCAEMVCTNSLRSDADDTAPGLLKAEMRKIGSLLLAAADRHRVPAGSALAVDRWRFAWHVTAQLALHPRCEIRRYELDRLPDEAPCILATGPLTTARLAHDVSRRVGKGFYFYDSIAPIVEADSIDWDKVFYGARHEEHSDDYVNCPMSKTEYEQFVAALRDAEKVPPHPFEEERYFEGCLPVEVMAARGHDALAYGPMRPIGLIDPRTEKRPYVAVQLRAENQERTCYNLVGFQTRMTYPEQKRVFRLIPGLERARFLRLGSIHRNSYLDSPTLLGERLQLLCAPHVKVAGQFAGVEGYLESAALGQCVGLLMASELLGKPISLPPITTALGALAHHVVRQRQRGERFEPSNITFGLMPAPPNRVRDKRARRLETRARAETDFSAWLETVTSLVTSPLVISPPAC